jgi:hypothetical protein
MRRSHLLLFPILQVILCAFTANAQTVLPDTSFVQQAVAGAVESYSKTVGMQAHLYTGPEYFALSKPHVEGHQFFSEKSFARGAVLYDGVWVEDVPLLYDVVLDEVITIHSNTGFSQMLVKEQVKAFKVFNHSFVHIKSDSLQGATLQPGFYDVLYNGKVQLVAKRKKSLQERASVNGMEGRYDIVDRFYLRKDGAYHQVSNKRSVLKVLQEEKKVLSKFARANKLKFKKERESAIIQIAQHYDTLKP